VACCRRSAPASRPERSEEMRRLAAGRWGVRAESWSWRLRVTWPPRAWGRDGEVVPQGVLGHDRGSAPGARAFRHREPSVRSQSLGLPPPLVRVRQVPVGTGHMRIDVDPQTMDRNAFSKLPTAVVVPRPIAWVSTLSADSFTANLAPTAFVLVKCLSRRSTGSAEGRLHVPGILVRARTLVIVRGQTRRTSSAPPSRHTAQDDPSSCSRDAHRGTPAAPAAPRLSCAPTACRTWSRATPR
jgi:hypothetical protein